MGTNWVSLIDVLRPPGKDKSKRFNNDEQVTDLCKNKIENWFGNLFMHNNKVYCQCIPKTMLTNSENHNEHDKRKRVEGMILFKASFSEMLECCSSSRSVLDVFSGRYWRFTTSRLMKEFGMFSIEDYSGSSDDSLTVGNGAGEYILLPYFGKDEFGNDRIGRPYKKDAFTYNVNVNCVFYIDNHNRRREQIRVDRYRTLNLHTVTVTGIDAHISENLRYTFEGNGKSIVYSPKMERCGNAYSFKVYLAPGEVGLLKLMISSRSNVQAVFNKRMSGVDK